MNAVSHLSISPWAGFLIACVDDLQRSDFFFAAARHPRGGHRQSRQPTR
ncbi:hypothetical protein QF019_000897 [Pseudomonas frederiksbergensis]